MGSFDRLSAEADGRRSPTGKGPADPSRGLSPSSNSIKDQEEIGEEEEPRPGSPQRLSQKQKHDPDRQVDDGEEQMDIDRLSPSSRIQSILSNPHDPIEDLPSRDHPASSKSDPNANLPAPAPQDQPRSAHWFNRWSTALSPVVWLENKSSVARDHLANERTFLAWFRTSLSLTSIGIALAQLSRIPKQIRTNQVNRSINSIQPILEPLRHTITKRSLVLSDGPSSLEKEVHSSLKASADYPPNQTAIESMLTQIDRNLVVLQASIDRLNQQSLEDDIRSRILARSIGNCYVGLGLIFLFLGTHRYFRVQKVLQTGRFPHSRRSIGFTTFTVTGLLIATVIGIFTTYP